MKKAANHDGPTAEFEWLGLVSYLGGYRAWVGCGTRALLLGFFATKNFNVSSAS
jgi:hypothetical protein